MRWMVATVLGLSVLGCGFADFVEGVGDQVEQAVADELAKGVAKGLGVPEDEVTIQKEGERWLVELPYGEGDCGLGETVDDEGLPLSMGDLLARCDVTVDLKEVIGDEAPEGIGDRFDVAVRRPTDLDGAVERRREELEAEGYDVMEGSDRGYTALLGFDDGTPAVVVVVGSGEAGPLELVAAPKDAEEVPGRGGKGGKGKAGKGKAGKGKAGKRPR